MKIHFPAPVLIAGIMGLRRSAARYFSNPDDTEPCSCRWKTT
jgi:hypothetical protein